MTGDDTFTIYDGSELTVLERPSAAGDPVVMRFRLVDACATPPPHIHPSAVETYEVEEGTLEVMLGREWRSFGAGESVTIEPGTRHTFRNRSGATATVRNTHAPHHDFETYIRTVAAVTHEFQVTEPRSPAAAARLALLFSRHSDLIRPADLPLKVAFPVLAAAARLLRLSIPNPA